MRFLFQRKDRIDFHARRDQYSIEVAGKRIFILAVKIMNQMEEFNIQEDPQVED
jgi:hypothetical protein